MANAERNQRSGAGTRRSIGERLFLVLGLFAVVCATASAMQSSDPAAAAGVATSAPAVGWRDLPIWPEPNPIQLSWFAAIAILALTLRARNPLSLASLDGISLAGAAILFVLRDLDGSQRGVGGHSWSWWAISLFPLIALYWLIRGILLFSGARPARLSRAALGGPVVVFAFVGLLLAGRSVATGLIPPAMHDGFIGATGMLESGALPYGDFPGHDSRGPLLYSFVAGVLKVTQPAVLPDVPLAEGPMAPERTIVFPADPPVRYDATALRGANALLICLATIALFIIGVGCGARSLGAGLAAIFLLFPGVREGFGDTELLLAATLLAWSLAFLFVPWVGSFFSALCLTLGGVSCPWLWLGIPLMLAFHLRRGAALVGTVCGLLLGFAALGFVFANHVRPTLPRERGVLAAADLPPRFRATLSADGQVLQISIDEREDRPRFAARLAAPMLRKLLEQEDLSLEAAFRRKGLPEFVLPDGVAPHAVFYTDIAAEGAAADVLQSEYRVDLAAAPDKTRFFAAIRTVIESTWLPAAPVGAADGAVEPSTWRAWSLEPGGMASRVDAARRAMKIIAILCALVMALGLLVRRDAGFGEFAGALLATLTLAFLASEPGSAARWAWIVPAILAAHAVQRETAAAPPEGYGPADDFGRDPVSAEPAQRTQVAVRSNDYVSLAELTRTGGGAWADEPPTAPAPPARTPDRPRLGPPPYRTPNPPNAG